MNSVTDNRQDAADPGETRTESGVETLELLRRFHYGEPGAAAATSKPSPGVLPALLNSYRDSSAIRYSYPLYLAPPNAADELAKPVSEYLAAALKALAPGADDARILKDNLAWLERYLRQKLASPEPADAHALFAEAAAALQTHLGLSAASRATLDADIERLQGTISAGSRFLGYGPLASLYLMLHAIRHRRDPAREQLRERVNRTVAGLQSLLDVENSKSVDANEPGAIKSSVGPGSRYFDTGALSGILEQRTHGSVAMLPERRRRIERALADLQSWQDSPITARFVGRMDDASFGEIATIELVDSDDPCARAGEVFERDAAGFARLFAALRIGALEIDGNYNPAVHDSWFANFDWQAFSDTEMQQVTPVMALVSADHLAGDGLPSFSRLLSSRLPIHVLSWIRAYDNPSAKPGEDPFGAYRFELAYFGIGHRQVVVAQTSAARYEDLLAGFLAALDSNRASLHLINRGTQSKAKQALLDPWFVASAALESRAHPFILVRPDAGDHAAERVSFAGNPQAENDWPVEKLEYRGADNELTEMDVAFTFADYALLMPALHEHFRSVPRGYDSADLVTVDQYLDLDAKLVDHQVPFVWGIDADGELVRLVVSHALVFACRDRLNYWRTLQELAGIHNFYVEEAIERVIDEQRAADAAEREKLLEAHEQQLQDVRSEAADTVMGQLVDVLMGADLSDMISDRAPASLPAREAPGIVAPAEPEPVAEAVQAESPAEESPGFDEPWLDTEMCTTCDDCMGINKMMFAYNENKQAFIRDPRAGTYADLVAAAELCPAKCIHPGKPLDANEPGLEELIARAAPFNS